MNKPPDIYRCIKLAFDQIAKSEQTIKLLRSYVDRANEIWRRSIHFLKYYLLEDLTRCSEIDTNFLDILMQSVCIQSTKGRKAEANLQQKTILMQIYQQFAKEFDQYLLPEMSYEHLNTVLDYIAITWMTAIENNIKSNYVTYVETYVNFHYDKNLFLTNLKQDKSTDKQTKDKLKREFIKRLRSIKQDILNVGDESKTCLNEEDKTFVDESKRVCLPNKSIYEKDLINYDIKVSPMDYLLPMFRMMQIIENVDSKSYKPRLKNVLPSRNSIISKHIRFDTKTLMNIFKFGSGNTVKECQELVWDEYFRTDRKCFKMKGYRFNNSIMTDGVSCVLLFIREDKYGKRVKLPKKVDIPEPYLEDKFNDFDEDHKMDLKSRNVVGIDPNLGNLIYCSDEAGQIFRYTQGQRKFEVKTKKFQEYEEKLKLKIIDGKSVVEWETMLSMHDSKTLNKSKYIAYLRDRYQIDQKLVAVYQNVQLKKNNLHRFRNRKKSENKMLQAFKSKFGDTDEVVVCFGDWEQKQHMKYKEPTKGKGLRRLFRKFGYSVYLIWEHRTSLQCSSCKQKDSQTEKFFKIEFHNSEGEPRMKNLHGLLKCKTCKRLWNRDSNSSNNMKYIGRSILDGNGRPSYLCKQTKESEVKEIEETTKSNSQSTNQQLLK